MLNSADFRDDLVSLMGSDAGKVTVTVEEGQLQPGQTAAVWFSNNQLAKLRRVCVVARGPRIEDIVLMFDYGPTTLVGSTYDTKTSKHQSLKGLVKFLQVYLLED